MAGNEQFDELGRPLTPEARVVMQRLSADARPEDWDGYLEGREVPLPVEDLIAEMERHIEERGSRRGAGA